MNMITSTHTTDGAHSLNTDTLADVDKSLLTSPLVAVYCGSRLGNNPIYQATAQALGRALAEQGLGLVYGGASIGLMGEVADQVLSAGGQVVGVIPEFMLAYEVAHPALTKLHITDTMHTRKAMMAEYADAFLTIPGGLGTLEELMEIATWGQLYQHQKPMIILNTNGFYDRLLEHLAYTVAEGFMKSEDLARIVVCHDVEGVLTHLSQLVLVHDGLDTKKI